MPRNPESKVSDWAVNTIESNERGENVDCNAQDDRGISPLMDALYFGDIDIVRQLLAVCPDIDCTLIDEDGQNMIDWVRTGLMDEHYMTVESVREMLNLLRTDCNVKLSCTTVLVSVLQDVIFELLLYRWDERVQEEAIRKGILDIVNDALECPGVNVNAQGDEGRTPLINAASSAEPALVKRLLEMNGIDVNFVNPTEAYHQIGGRNALMVALNNGKFLIPPPPGELVKMVRLLAPLTDLTHVDNLGNSALSLAKDLMATYIEGEWVGDDDFDWDEGGEDLAEIIRLVGGVASDLINYDKKLEDVWVEDQRAKYVWLLDDSTTDEDRRQWEMGQRRKFNRRSHPYWKVNRHPLGELVVVEEKTLPVLTPRCNDFDGDEEKCKTAAFAGDEEGSSCQYQEGQCIPRPYVIEREDRWRKKQEEIDETCIGKNDIFGTKSRFTGNWERGADYIDPETTVVVYTDLFENAEGEQKGTCFEQGELKRWFENQKPQYEWISREGMEEKQYGSNLPGDGGIIGVEFEYDENKQTESNFIGYLPALGKPYTAGRKFYKIPVWAGKGGESEEDLGTWSSPKGQHDLWVDEDIVKVLLDPDTKTIKLEPLTWDYFFRQGPRRADEKGGNLRLGGIGYGESGVHGQYVQQLWGIEWAT